jgi:isopenicillin N synthase-like dioxygenase
MSRAIPLVDLKKFTSGTPQEKKQFVDELGHAFQEFGFVGVINHGISKELVDRFYTESKAFFSLPTEVKSKYEHKQLAGQRGYTSFGKEHAKQSNVGDLKEFFQLGQEAAADHPLKAEYPDNVHVAEVPAFTKTGIELYKAFETSGAKLLQAIALYLGLKEHYFDEKIEMGNSILRAIHYPPITQ